VEELVAAGKVKAEVLEKLRMQHPDTAPGVARNATSLYSTPGSSRHLRDGRRGASGRVRDAARLAAALEQTEDDENVAPRSVLSGRVLRSKTLRRASASARALAGLDLGALHEDLQRFQSDPMVKEALSKEVDLRRYAQRTDDDLLRLQTECVCQHLAPDVLDAVAALHVRLERADRMLAAAQGHIRGFQTDLGDVSSEMRRLHARCTLLDTKRKNRAALEGRLKGFLGRVAVPSTMRPVLERGVDGEGAGPDVEYLRVVRSLNDKIRFVRASEREAARSKGNERGLKPPYRPAGVAPGTTAAARNVAPQLEELRALAVTGAQQHLMRQIARIRGHAADPRRVQRVQRDRLQPYSFLAHFLGEHSSRALQEVEDGYVAAMRRSFSQVLTGYGKRLQRWQAPHNDRSTMIAVPDAGRRSLFTTRVATGRNTKKATDYRVHERQAALRDMGQHGDWIDPSQLQRDRAAADLPYEVVFRSLMKRLMELATFEMLFLEHFFAPSAEAGRAAEAAGGSANEGSANGGSAHRLGPGTGARGTDARGTDGRATRIFEQSIGQALTDIVAQVQASIGQSWDAVGLLLLVQLVHGVQRTTTEQLPELARCMRGFWSRLLTSFWARFRVVVHDNLKCMREARADRLGPPSLHSHVTAMRFASLVAAMWTVGGFLEEDAQVVAHSIAQLSQGFQELLGRLAKAHVARRDRAVFLSNNYDTVLTAFAEARADFAEVAGYRRALEEQIFLFTEELLRENFAGLMKFAEAQGLAGARAPGAAAGAAAEAPGRAGPPTTDGMESAALEKIVVGFATGYKASIQKMDSAVIKSFNNAQLANAILKRAFSQLLAFHNAFHGAIKRRYPDGSSGRPLWLRSLVGTGAIMVEIKRYSRAL
jgi:hypothetical protein